MAAGDRATEQSRLAAERVAQLRRKLEQAERAERAWAAGATGEAKVAEKLDELLSQGWLVLHDVRWPGRPKANLDHILVGPGGVIVVDAKNWTGDVQIRNGVLRQNGYSRAREVTGALQQSAAVAELLEPQDRRFVQAWLCMVGQPWLQGFSEDGVRIQGLARLSEAVAELPVVLDPDFVRRIHAYLQGLLGGTASPPPLITAHITGQVNHVGAAAESLQKWRTASPLGAVPVPVPPTPNPLPPTKASRLPRLRGTRLMPMWTRPLPLLQTRRTSSSRSSRRRPKQKWYVELFKSLVLLGVGFALLHNFATNVGSAKPTAPRPTPSVSQTVPAR